MTVEWMKRDKIATSGYQHKQNNRTLLLPFINGSKAQRVRLLDFGPKEYDLVFKGRSREDLQQGYSVAKSQNLKMFVFIDNPSFFVEEYVTVMMRVHSCIRYVPYFGAKNLKGYDYSTRYDYPASACTEPGRSDKLLRIEQSYPLRILFPKNKIVPLERQTSGLLQ